MFENIAAIDVGTYSVKVVTVRTGFRDFQLRSFAYEDINGAMENHSEGVHDALNRLLADEDLKGFKILTNLPMEKEIIRNISFPFSDVEKIADAIPYEAEENIPFKMDDLVMDFQPLRSSKESEGRILLAAAHKESIQGFLTVLNTHNIKPSQMGMEANALFECYRYFNKIDQEAVVQIDMGTTKSILNLIHDNHLLYTRSIPVGVGTIHQIMADVLKKKIPDIHDIYDKLNLDLTSFENNIQRGMYKELGISHQKMKKIFTMATEKVHELIEQIMLTMKALFVDYDVVEFSRVLISGGGSSIPGLGTLLSHEMGLPVVSLPFLEGYDDPRIKTQFPIAFGTILSYINSRRSSINFLKGEFIPDIASESRKIYYLSGGFAVLTIILFIINIIITAILTSSANSEYNDLVQKKYKDYFRTREVSDDPIADANKLLKKEKKELDSITQIMPEDSSTMDMLKDMLSFFPQDSDFTLKNLVLNERVMRIDGIVGSSTSIDSFKENLVNSKKYESVTLNIRYSRKNEVSFSLTIKLKISSDDSNDRG